mgnify:CR=1 FL=1
MSTILIVEDDVNINEMLKVALQKEGYSCIQAFQGQRQTCIISGGAGFGAFGLDASGDVRGDASGGDPADKAGGTGHCPVGQR